MASDHQVALTRMQRMPVPSTHISKAARQVVPAFLQKLYEMVNDPNNAELIRWSEAGDSFFVLDHERFAHEVLGRWFKHRNFSSFVRQLNMYGFHKIPHLQQGVLKSDTDTEFWNFAHANFHRGQPDLLCLIQRKKQIPQPGEEGALDLRDPNSGVGLAALPAGASGSQAAQGTSAGHILDIQSIVNGITAIKRHQTTISAELNELKRSNQLLWQDALAARARHQKQQDTVNRILKFLAGVFGQHAGTTGPVTPNSPNVPGGTDGEGQTSGMKRRMRLMIEDAKRDGPMKSVVEELPMEMDDDYNYPMVETPNSVQSPVSVATNIADTPTYYSSNPNSNSTPTTSSKASESHTRSTSSTSTTAEFTYPPETQQQQQQQQQQPQVPSPSQPQQQQQTQHQQGKQISRSVTPSRHNSQSFEFDPRLQGVLNQLTPSQIQHLLSSLASQPLNDTTSSGSSLSTGTINPSATNATGGLLTQYHQPSSFDFSINPATQGNVYTTSGDSITTPDDLIPFEMYERESPSQDDRQGGSSTLGLTGHPDQANLERQWQAAEDIDKDVNALNTSINSLIQTFGLDPSLLDDTLSHTGTNGTSGTQSLPGTGVHNDEMQNANTNDANINTTDFDFFDSFFNNMPGSADGAGVGLQGGDNVGAGNAAEEDMDYNDLASTAFLDEVPTPASSDVTGSPVQSLRQVYPNLQDLSIANTDDNAPLSSGLNLPTGMTKMDLPPPPTTTTTTMVDSGASPAGRLKRKSDVTFDLEGLQAAAAEDLQGTATKLTGATKTKRRKDK